MVHDRYKGMIPLGAVLVSGGVSRRFYSLVETFTRF